MDPMTVNRLDAARREVRNWVERCLAGPFARPLETDSDTVEEELPFRPSELYQCGILFGPLPDLDSDDLQGDSGLPGNDLSDSLDSLDSAWGVGEDEQPRDTASKASVACHYRPPSGVGLSFFVSPDISLDVRIRASRYSRKNREGRTTWKRRLLPDTRSHEDSVSLRPSDNDQQLEETFLVLSDRNRAGDGNGSHFDRLHVKWRPHRGRDADGYIVTISVQNRAMVCSEPVHRWNDKWEETHLFQLFFQCHVTSGTVFPYPGNEILNLDEEDREFELLYSDKTIYAIGHGVSPDWELDDRGQVMSVRAAFIPSIEVPVMKTDVRELDAATLRLSLLAGADRNVRDVQDRLASFTGIYDQWIRGLRITVDAMPDDRQQTARTMLDRLDRSSRRMNGGLRCLDDPMVARAFSFAHRAMLDYMNARGVAEPFWRPFQLGFLLQEIPSLISRDDPDRDVVDLLWFQTGGGKTEAYLAIISFLVAFRRMRYPDTGGGTAVIMRYTLRLLTIQQFQRASIVICALELLRRRQPDLLGKVPITAGLWVGAASSPNTVASAGKILHDALNSDGYGLEAFVITECPWCGHPLRPDPDPNASGFCCDGTGFAFCCRNLACDFGGSENPVLPVNVVDQHLYQHPPTLLLATVDKFALFAWKEETTAFLGNAWSSPLYSTGASRPPDLIIQDELHLIAGELGTIAGLYEAGFDAVLSLQGHGPKYIASTATIRNAREQVRKLYARDVAVFPSPGINWSDSFFARVDHDRPGRLYMGYYSPNLGRTESFAPLGAALLTAPSIWKDSDEAVQDAWWTLVAYHGSLRGLGITHNLLSDDVIKYMNYYIHFMLDDEVKETSDHARAFNEFCERFGVDIGRDGYKQVIADRFVEFRRLYAESGIAELTSNRNAGEIRNYLSDLEIGYSSENNQAISTLLCTNMVSVGLDIARLGLMVINGQPFTTGEYIQASSRVGRNQVPGIVVAHYFRNHARDMSHYENFRAYHESFYRFVEPTSLTPFSAPARQRALHAALVIVMRHAAGLLLNDMADRMTMENPDVRRAVDVFLGRCRSAAPDQYEKTKAHVEQLLYHWQELVSLEGWERKPVQYDTPPGRRDKLPLLIRYDDIRARSSHDGRSGSGGWLTLQSMRSVDEECGIVFVGRR